LNAIQYIIKDRSAGVFGTPLFLERCCGHSETLALAYELQGIDLVFNRGDLALTVLRAFASVYEVCILYFHRQKGAGFATVPFPREKISRIAGIISTIPRNKKSSFLYE
jgi:hypothetical protein